MAAATADPATDAFPTDERAELDDARAFERPSNLFVHFGDARRQGRTSTARRNAGRIGIFMFDSSISTLGRKPRFKVRLVVIRVLISELTLISPTGDVHNRVCLGRMI